MAARVFSSDKTSLKEIGDKYVFFLEHFESEYMAQVVKDGLESFYLDANYSIKQVKYALSYSLENSIKQFLDLYRNVTICKKRNIKKLLENYWNFIKA